MHDTLLNLWIVTLVRAVIISVPPVVILTEARSLRNIAQDDMYRSSTPRRTATVPSSTPTRSKWHAPVTTQTVHSATPTARPAAHTASCLHPTAEGMCVVADREELYCSEHPCCITIRSAVAATKFVVKQEVYIPEFASRDAVIRSLHYPGGGDWVWCAASSGELVAVHVVSHKYTMISDAVRLGAAGPVVCIGHVCTMSPIPGSLQSTVSLASHGHVVVITVARNGTVGLWDSGTRTIFARVAVTAGGRLPSRRWQSSPSGHGDGTTSGDSPVHVSRHRTAADPHPSPSPLQQLAASGSDGDAAHRVQQSQTSGSTLKLKACSSWSHAGVTFLGDADGVVYTLDARNLNHVVVEAIPEASVADGGAILSMSFEPCPRHLDEGTLWIATSTGAIGRVVCQLSTGAAQGAVCVQQAPNVQRGVHSGYCHKVCASGTHHIVSCGSDGRIAILDAETMNIVQRVSLEPGNVVQEVVCLGEIARGSVSMLLAVSDRSFRCMSLKVTGASLPGSRHASPRRMGSDHSSPRRVGDHHHRHLSLPSSPLRLGNPTQTLIYHCLTLLKQLSAVEAEEDAERSVLCNEAISAQSGLEDYWGYLALGGRLQRLPAGVQHLQLQEADVRCYWTQQFADGALVLLRTCNAAWARLSRRRECEGQHEACIDSERLLRDQTAALESAEWCALILRAEEGATCCREIAFLREQLAEQDVALGRLETNLVHLSAIEQRAAMLPAAQNDVANLRASLAAVTEACDALDVRCAEAEAELRGVKDAYYQEACLRRLDAHQALSCREESSRAHLVEAAMLSLCYMCNDARGEAVRRLHVTLHDAHNVQARCAALQQHAKTLEGVALGLQRELRDAEFAADGHRATCRRVEDELLCLKETFQEAKARLTASDDARAAKDIENIRLGAACEQLRLRLEQSTQLAEDTFKTVLAQREETSRLHSALQEVQVSMSNLVRVGERAAFDSRGGPSETQRLHDARGLLRMAQEALIAIRRLHGAQWSQLEDDMAQSLVMWDRHARAAETRRLPNASGVGSGTDENVAHAADIGTCVQRAFASVCRVSELIGVDWEEGVLVIPKDDFVTSIKHVLATVASSGVWQE